jgi:predicted Zn-dependent protease
MAHEIAHVAACHIAREQTRGNLANIASIPLIFVGGGIGYAVESAAGLALPVTFMKFSRGFEAEADYLGVQYLYKSGYDPQSFAAFFEKVEALEKKKPGFLDKAFDSHPPTPERAAQTQKEIATILPARDEYVVDTSEFQDVKARLARIENRRKVDNPNGKPEPSLRRGQQPGQTPGTDDDHPPLKRTGNDSR